MTEANIGPILAFICSSIGGLLIVFALITYSTNKAEPQGGASEHRMIQFITGAIAAFAAAGLCVALNFTYTM